MTEPSPLETAIAQLQAQRSALGDAAVDAAVGALRANAKQATQAMQATQAQQSPEAPLAQQAQPQAQAPRLRLVSVLFVDVADSTAMLERVGAEDALALVSDALEAFARIVRAHGGQVLRFTGDGLKAAFGSLRLREDDAAQAVRAGLRILEAAAEHAERVARPLGIARFGVRAGIHTGMVLLGDGVDEERGAIGHAVHLAARMEQSAPVGRLRISRETREQVRGLFRLEAQPPLVVKGLEEPLVTFLVKRDEDEGERTVRRGIEGLATPMVGREPALQGLLGLCERSVRTRRAALAVVTGEAGMGKTRLRRELLKRVGAIEGAPPRPRSVTAATAHAVHCLRVRAQPSSELQAYGLLRQLLARWLGIFDDLTADEARARLVGGLGPWLGADAQARAQRVGQLVGLDFGAVAAVQALGARELREQAFGALGEALRAVAASTPLLLVFEDLHWADEASLDFVKSLAQPAPVPLLLLILARPGWAEARALPAETPEMERQHVHLPPLGDASCTALADALLGAMQGAPEPLRQLLLQRAGGNPFFMEELVRMLIDDGVIDTRTRPWRLVAERLSELRVPETLLGVLQARLDALPAAELAALQQASIVGPVFWSSALAELDAAAPAALPVLMHRGLLVRRQASAFGQSDEYAFQHQLLHDVTYGTVLKAARREGHARAARWLAARAVGREREFVVITAEHYERAGDSARALEFYDRARRDAEARFAHDAALRLIDRALAQPALTAPRHRFRLLHGRHIVFDRQERREEAGRAAQAMHEWAEACDDDVMRADLATAKMLRADHEGRAEDAQRLAEQAVALLAHSTDPAAAPPLTLAHGELAWLAVGRRDFVRAEPHLAEALEQARRTALLPGSQGGYDGYELQLRSIEIHALALQERHAEAARAAERGLASLARRPRPLPHDRYILLQLLYRAQHELGAWQEARATAQQALECALELAMPRLQTTALLDVAQSALALGEIAGAQDAADQAMRLVQAAGNDFVRPLVHQCLGHVAAARGDADGARAALQRALDLYAAQGREPEVAQMRCEIAALDLAGGRAADALRAVDEVLATASNAGDAGYRQLDPDALLTCVRVLDARAGVAGVADAADAADVADDRAAGLLGHLQLRLQEQLAQLPDDLARSRVQALPHWAALRRRVAEGPPRATAASPGGGGA
ncbi:MAG: AAA family ATPase [Burkholderiales bacterium]|nr:AAA family ATPase [Burkholderiales bacterium]